MRLRYAGVLAVAVLLGFSLTPSPVAELRETLMGVAAAEEPNCAEVDPQTGQVTVQPEHCTEPP